MKNKDQILLEQAYSKILKEDGDKFQPHDPEMQELSKVGMGEEYPEEEKNSSNEEQWHFDNDDDWTRHYIQYSNRTFNVRGQDVLIKNELIERTDDDETWLLTLVDPETKKRVFPDIKEDQIKKMFFDR
jgi:hypothetical protein